MYIFKQIMPADGWHAEFIFHDDPKQEKPPKGEFRRVVAWALVEDDETQTTAVVACVNWEDVEVSQEWEDNARGNLVPVSEVDGFLSLVHQDDLATAQIKLESYMKDLIPDWHRRRAHYAPPPPGPDPTAVKTRRQQIRDLNKKDE